MGLSGSLFASQFTYVTPSANPASATFRNGFQYTLLTRGEDIRRTPGVVIKDTLNNSPNTCAFTVDGSAPVPLVGEKIEIRDSFDDDRRLFAGTVQSVEQIYEGQTDQLAFRVSAIDFTWLANRKRPFGTYVNTSVTTIVKDLIARFAPGFTVGHVQTNLAKVTAVFDGSKDLTTCLNDLAAAIGGGHWYFDYDMDLHFFHIVPTGLVIPPSAMPPSTAFMTVSESTAIPAGHIFEAGYYIFRHTFIYSDGTESSYQMISNMLRCTGSNILQFTGVPTGTPIGTTTCVGRRIYYNKFIPGYPGGDPIEKIVGFCQINDNTTTSFTTWFGANGASVASIVSLGSVKTYSTPLVAAPGVPAWILLSDQAATLNLTGAISNGVYGDPNGVKLNPPSTFGTLAGFAPAPPSGWTVGSTIYYKYTRTNSNGETTPGPTGSVTLTSAGLRFLAPLTQNDPDAGAYMVLYISDDNVNFHDIGAGLVPGQGVNFVSNKTIWATFPSPPSVNTAVVGIARGWIGYNGVTPIAEGAWLQPVLGGNIVYYASADVASALEAAVDNAQAKPPTKSFNAHPAGPAAALAATQSPISGVGYFNGGRFQFKYAFLYRDGSVSFPSPATPNVDQPIIKGSGLGSFSFTNIAVGPTVSGLDVVARFIYWCGAGLVNPNFSISGELPIGFVWPNPFAEVTWATPGGIAIIADNTTTSLSTVALTDLNTTFNGFTGVACGRGNVPYGNANQQAISVDPIPMWPNPDGPSLEDSTLPADLTNENTDLLHEDSGSQPFTVSTDISQIRNRVYVIGSGSVVTQTANAGDTQVSIADIAAFSPHGGTVKYDDPGTGDFVKLAYNGVGGIPGATFISLAQALTKAIPQGSTIANFFQADDIESQKFMAKSELDANGLTGDGIHEYTIVDSSLKAVFQLFMRAYAELELYSKPIVTIKYATRDPLSRSGRMVHADMDSPPCLGDFLIQDVQIDQIHDESDDLLPRYTVTASSVKFDLNDLLLKIIGGQVGGSSTSYAGIIPTATTTSASLAAGESIPLPTAGKRKWTMVTIHRAGVNDQLNAGIASGFTTSGSNSAQDDNAAVGGICSNWTRYTPSASNGNLDGLFSSENQLRWDQLPKFMCRFRTAPTLFGWSLPSSSHRTYWFGLASASGVTQGGTVALAVPHVMLLAQDPGDSGGNWEVSYLSAGNGGTQIRTSSGFMAMLPNTHYLVTVQALSSVAAQVTLQDLTHATQASVNVTFGSYNFADVPVSANRQWGCYAFGSANMMQASTSYVDLGAIYMECD
jgi:hypothetical protein